MRIFICRKKRTIIFLLIFIASSTTLVRSNSAYADTTWAELLKPLVKDVIVPGASAGMKKLMEKKMKVKLDSSSDSSSSYTQENSMTMPEEPMTGSDSGQGGLISMPDESTYRVSSDNPKSTADAPPPPPVMTP